MKESRLGSHRSKPLMGCLPHFSSHVERRGLEDSSLQDLSYGCDGQESYIVMGYHNDNDNNNNNNNNNDDEEVENHQALPLLVVSPPSKGLSPMLIRLLKNHHGSHSFPNGSGREDAVRDHHSHHSFGRHKKGLRILTNIVGGTAGNGHCSDISANHVSPKGFVFVFVGKNEPMKRFLVPISLLNHPLLQDVLHEAQLEFGFNHQGPLRLPCQIDEFERTLKTINIS